MKITQVQVSSSIFKHQDISGWIINRTSLNMLHCWQTLRVCLPPSGEAWPNSHHQLVPNHLFTRRGSEQALAQVWLEDSKALVGSKAGCLKPCPEIHQPMSRNRFTVPPMGGHRPIRLSFRPSQKNGLTQCSLRDPTKLFARTHRPRSFRAPVASSVSSKRLTRPPAGQSTVGVWVRAARDADV